MTIEDIKDLLERDASGKFKSTIHNGLIIFRNDPLFAHKIKYNILRGAIDIVGEMPWNRDDIAIDDNDISFIKHYLEHTYDWKNKECFFDVLNIISNENQYHPVRERLEGLVWDGIPRIDHCLHHFFGCEETKLINTIFRTFLFGALARVFNPGCKFDNMIILVGGQGKGKSTFFRYLALDDEWFSDDLNVIGDRKVHERISGHWIIEMAEMNATQTAKSVEEIKAFLSRQKDNYRKPYAHEPKDWKRNCVFTGTANKIAFMPLDRTGNRRMLPIRVYQDMIEQDIMKDEEYSRRYIEQVWAEAMQIWKSEKPETRIPREMEEEFNRYQQQFMREDTDKGIILNYIATTKNDYICTRMIYKEAFDLHDTPSKSKLADIGEIIDGAIVEGELPDWDKLEGTHRMGEYGSQRGWKRKNHQEYEQPTMFDGPFGPGKLTEDVTSDM